MQLLAKPIIYFQLIVQHSQQRKKCTPTYALSTAAKRARETVIQFIPLTNEEEVNMQIVKSPMCQFANVYYH